MVPVNIFEFCKCFKGNVWQRLKKKMMGMKIICNRRFLKRFMYTVYLTFSDKFNENITILALLSN